jgi:tetratricopeptide (TPR) repeat protein
MELARTIYGDGDPMLSSYLNHLAVALWRRGRPEEAEPLFVEALRTMRQALGDRHTAVASPLNNLANLLQSVGRHAEAETFLREALAIVRESAGERHPNVAQVLANLGVAVQARGELGEAESLFRRSWSMNRELLGEQHPSSLQSADLLSRVLIERGAFEEVRSIQRQILETRQSLFGEQSEHAATSLLFLAYAWHREGAMSEAEELYRLARVSAAASLGTGHWLVARIDSDLAEVLASTGRLAEGLPLAERAVAVLDETFPGGHPEHWRAAYAASTLAELRMQRGDRDVEALLVDSHRTLRSVKGESALVTREAERRLAHFRAGGSR